MHISVTDAKAQLTELVRRAEEGDEVILTRHGQPAAKLVPLKKRLSPEARRKLIEELQKSAAEKALPGPCAARSQDFLYGDDGLPA
jgi:prevent-host-death family protein